MRYCCHMHGHPVLRKTCVGLLATPVFVVAAAAVFAAPALAATTFTVSPGGAWSGTRAADSTVGIRDAVSNQVTLCSGLAAAGSFKSGKGLSGTNIGALFDRIDLGGFGDSIADSSAIISPAQRISSP